MLREGTAVPAVWFSLELMYGVYALKHGPEASGQFCGLPAKPNHRSTEPDCARRRAASYQNWFELAPKAANIIVKGEKMGPEPVIKGLWAVTAVVSVVILFVALFW